MRDKIIPRRDRSGPGCRASHHDHQARQRLAVSPVGSRVMSLVSYRCPKTSKDVRTGIDTDDSVLARMKKMKVGVVCPHCPEGHIVTADSMFFSFEVMSRRSTS